ncbi:hypothetical protein COT72_03630 [archaeon CG10_big_fil_rev_8_21_14_0_10_43_11]|nr:MAG: hypothetical protein COT72_03630 [archaeon CG10_big_fil_rev_8_21_14_0_10_43_11]
MAGEWIVSLPWLKIAYAVVAILVTVILYKLIQSVEDEEEPAKDEEKKRVESLPWNEFKAVTKKAKKIKKARKTIEMEDAFYEAKEIKTDYGEKEYA